MYDRKSGAFLAPMIGAFHTVSKVQDEHGISLLGTARINKRNADVTQAIFELYERGELNFSFEILAQHISEEGGVTVVDVAEGNRLTAMAIVTTPAYPSATALSLAAELDTDAIRGRVWRAADQAFNNVWVDILQIGADYAYIYLPEAGKMMRMEFTVGEEDLTVTDIFEVRFERAEEETVETLRAQRDEARQKLDALKREYAEAAELARKQNEIRAAAQRMGLDLSVEAVAEAIEKVDYAMLCAQVQEPKVTGVVQHVISAEISLNPYGNMLEKSGR